MQTRRRASFQPDAGKGRLPQRDPDSQLDSRAPGPSPHLARGAGSVVLGSPCGPRSELPSPKRTGRRIAERRPVLRGLCAWQGASVHDSEGSDRSRPRGRQTPKSLWVRAAGCGTRRGGCRPGKAFWWPQPAGSSPSAPAGSTSGVLTGVGGSSPFLGAPIFRQVSRVTRSAIYQTWTGQQQRTSGHSWRSWMRSGVRTSVAETCPGEDRLGFGCCLARDIQPSRRWARAVLGPAPLPRPPDSV